MISFSNSYNKIDEIDELVSAAVIASLLEVSALKPGNVHPNRNIPSTRFEHFLCANVVVYNSLKEIALGGSIGTNILQAVNKTKKWQHGGNINFGILLLFAPILAAAGKMIKEKKEVSNMEELKRLIKEIVDGTTYEDSVKIYQAIKIVQPGGLGSVEDLDVNNEDSIRKIIDDKIDLKYIFNQASSWDNIAREWVTNYEISFKIGLPFFSSCYEKNKDLFKCITLTFLKILSEYPDTLIIRKTNKQIALEISKKAKEILEIKDPLKQNKEIFDFDDYLHGFNGKYNPGTTADLVANTIFLAIINGLHF